MEGERGGMEMGAHGPPVYWRCSKNEGDATVTSSSFVNAVFVGVGGAGAVSGFGFGFRVY